MAINLIDQPPSWNKYRLYDNISLDEIHIFKILVADHYQSIKKLIPEILSDSEIEKANRIFSLTDKERYLASKYFLRTILSQWVDATPNQVDFITHEHKKPTVKGVEFNISHTGEYIVIAVSPEVIGIDLEYINQSFDFGSLLDITFIKEEIEFIGNEPIDSAKFYTLWTRKEAVLKASGEGASNNLHLIACLAKTVSRRNTTFSLNSFLIENNYVVSTAVTLKAINVNYWQVV
jgi:4'-phosphopantetheinyl transferase